MKKKFEKYEEKFKQDYKNYKNVELNDRANLDVVEI